MSFFTFEDQCECKPEFNDKLKPTLNERTVGASKKEKLKRNNALIIAKHVKCCN